MKTNKNKIWKTGVIAGMLAALVLAFSACGSEPEDSSTAEVKTTTTTTVTTKATTTTVETTTTTAKTTTETSEITTTAEAKKEPEKGTAVAEPVYSMSIIHPVTFSSHGKNCHTTMSAIHCFFQDRHVLFFSLIIPAGKQSKIHHLRKTTDFFIIPFYRKII